MHGCVSFRDVAALLLIVVAADRAGPVVFRFCDAGVPNQALIRSAVHSSMAASRTTTALASGRPVQQYSALTACRWAYLWTRPCTTEALALLPALAATTE